MENILENFRMATQIEKLEIENVIFHHDIISGLKKFLPKLHQLKHINIITSSKCGNKIAQLLSDIFLPHKKHKQGAQNLEYLGLSCDSMTNHGLKCLKKLLITLPKLHTVDLWGNGLTPAFADAFILEADHILAVKGREDLSIRIDSPLISPNQHPIQFENNLDLDDDFLDL